LSENQLSLFHVKNSKVKLIDILTHSAGFEWWKELYKETDYNLPIEKKWQLFLTASFQSVQDPVPDVSVYSDLGFLSLKPIIENLFNKSLKEIWVDLCDVFYTGFSIHFNENNKLTHDEKFYAPSERCNWRGRLLKGEVHDENAWMLNGISTHAGLFGSIDDLSSFGLQMRGNLLGIAKSPVKSKTMRLFLTRARPSQKGDWALGYMMPTPGGSSSGVYFSPYSVGHTGFTGTSFWFDPSADLLISILSNRVFWGREKKNFTELRPQIHNWIVETLRRI
jgi:CubicO group peptidase (beta-lactamase class C family)